MHLMSEKEVCHPIGPPPPAGLSIQLLPWQGRHLAFKTIPSTPAVARDEVRDETISHLLLPPLETPTAAAVLLHFHTVAL